MKILIIGGTKFLGRHLVEAALAQNHSVTLFNRGKHSSSEVMPEIEIIHGDRRFDLSELQNRRWDACIDTCGYLPQNVKASAEILSGAVQRYVFVSTISTYADFSVSGMDETAPLAELTEEKSKKASEIDASCELTGASVGKLYGELKVLCEREAENEMPGRVLVVRPGLIVGRFDPTDRFTYWVMRASKGGEVLAPGRPDRFVQLIDARDLSEWIITMIERGDTGIFNATGISEKLTMEQLLSECLKENNTDASFTWVGEDFLSREKIHSWSEMPLWISEENEPEMKGFLSISSDKAIASGLKFRNLSETIRDVLTWRQTDYPNEQLKAGIDSAKERELLDKWHNLG